MDEKLFNHIDIPRENIHIPSGEVPMDQVEEECRKYEELIAKYGGIDIQILGIGRTGHIGFNEPGSSRKSKTRLLHLDKKTRYDAISSFFTLEAVPHMAITMGVGTILSAKRIFMLAFAEHKASIVKKAIEGEIDEHVAASFLQEHPCSECIIDLPASTELTRRKTPWVLIGGSNELFHWTPKMIRKAVIWLSFLTKKPILKLTIDDYTDNHLTRLINEHGPVHKLNVRIFNELKSTITGWPGGKPQNKEVLSQCISYVRKNMPVGVTTRKPQYYLENEVISRGIDDNSPKDEIYPKRIIVFSPHPDDDVISMGGTLIRLVEQGHIVHVAYQTSGNIAVWDDDAKRFSNFVTKYLKAFNIPGYKEAEELESKIETYIQNKKTGEPDGRDILKIKGLIRETEAFAAARYCGVAPENIHFLSLPFYETGEVKKKPLSETDIDIVTEFIERIKPHQIYAAGDLSDPHGTHRVCLESIIGALKRLQDKTWFEDCNVWLYRGAWQEWDPEDIDMAIPISPDELMQKRYAIYKHQSQKDPAPFPGSDPREFWQRSEARNRETAKIYDRLGLTEYEAMEAFVKYDIKSPEQFLL